MKGSGESDIKNPACGKKGMTSVFLMSILISMLLVTAFFTEAMASVSARSYGTSLLTLSGRSVLSYYDQNLWKDYGIFGFSMEEEEVEDLIVYFTEKTLKNGTKPLLPLKLDAVKTDCGRYVLTNGEVLSEQIADYMKYRLVGNIQEELTSEKANQKRREATQNTMEVFDSLEELEHGTEISEKAQKIYQNYGNALDEYSSLKPLWERWKRAKSQAENSDENASEQEEDHTGEKEALEVKLQKGLTKAKVLLNICQRDINRLRSVYKKEEAGDAGISIMADMDRIEAELVQLHQVSVESLESDFQGILQNEEEGSRKRHKLSQQFNRIQGLFSMPESEGKEDIKDLTVLRNEEIKMRLPSVLCEIFRRESGGQHDAATKMDQREKAFITDGKKNFDQICVNLYIKEKFNNAVFENETKETLFQNEMEYINFGYFNDKTNGQAVKAKLFALRTASNLLHIYGCREKRAEALAMATMLTPGPAAPVTQALLSSLWAAAEAKQDLYHLMKGEKIPFFKTKESFHTSLSGAVAERVTENEVKSQEGLDYEEYLSLFILLQKKEEKLLRVMDLIQINLQGRYQQDFNMCDCYGGFQVTGTFSRTSGYLNLTPKKKVQGIVRLIHTY